MTTNMAVVTPAEVIYTIEQQNENDDEHARMLYETFHAAGINRDELKEEVSRYLRVKESVCGVLQQKRGKQKRRFSLPFLAYLTRFFSEPLAVVSFPISIEDPLQKHNDTRDLISNTAGIFLGAIAPGDKDFLRALRSDHDPSVSEFLELFKMLVTTTGLPSTTYMMRDLAVEFAREKGQEEGRREMIETSDAWLLDPKGPQLKLEDLRPEEWACLRAEGMAKNWIKPHHWPGGWRDLMGNGMSKKQLKENLPENVGSWLNRKVGQKERETTIKDILHCSGYPEHFSSIGLEEIKMDPAMYVKEKFPDFDKPTLSRYLSNWDPKMPGIVEMAQKDEQKADILVPMLNNLPSALENVIHGHFIYTLVTLTGQEEATWTVRPPKGPLSFNVVCLTKLLQSICEVFVLFRLNVYDKVPGHFAFDEPDTRTILEVSFSTISGSKEEGGVAVLKAVWVRIFERGIASDKAVFDYFLTKIGRDTDPVVSNLETLGVEDLTFTMLVAGTDEEADPEDLNQGIWWQKNFDIKKREVIAKRELKPNKEMDTDERPPNFEFKIPILPPKVV